MAARESVVVRFVQERETKNTVRYAEVPENPDAPEILAIGTLYVQKATLRALNSGVFPQDLTIKIEAGQR